MITPEAIEVAARAKYDASGPDIKWDELVEIAKHDATTGDFLDEERKSMLAALTAAAPLIVAGERAALEPFARAYRVLHPSSKVDEEAGARDHLPRVWPTIGDLRRADDAIRARPSVAGAEGEKG